LNDDPKIRNPGPQNTEPPRHQAKAAKKCLLLPSEDIQDEFKRAFFNSLGETPTFPIVAEKARPSPLADASE